MINNNKCILVYGLSNDEIQSIDGLGHKVIEITPEMCQMTVTDIVKGINLSTVNINPIDEKVILYNNFPERELRSVINSTREKVKGGILAMITPTSTKWKINYLIEHLIEEREWHKKNRKV